MTDRDERDDKVDMAKHDDELAKMFNALNKSITSENQILHLTRIVQKQSEIIKDQRHLSFRGFLHLKGRISKLEKSDRFKPAA